MNEDKKWYDNVVFNWVRNTDQSSKVFASVSAFLMSITVYVIAQGFAKGFSYDVLWNWTSLIVGFAGGLGIPAVQEDGIRKAILKFLSNPLFKKYREENIDLSYEVDNRDFQREFIKTTNEKELEVIKEEELEKQSNKLKDLIFTLEAQLEIAKLKKSIKIQKSINVLQTELDRIIKYGIDITKLDYDPMQIDDLFNFADNKKLKGRKRLIDNSVSLHRKANILARFYMPIIMMVLQGSALGVLKDNKGDVFIATTTFFFILVYVWYHSYSKQIELKENIAIPSEISKNTLLRQAGKEYMTWKITPPKVEEEFKKEDVVEIKQIEKGGNKE